MNSQLHGLVLLLVMSCYYILPLFGAQNDSSLIEVDVGLILDMDDDFVGKMSRTCIYMALEDFYASHGQNYTTKIVLHPRDSKSDVVEAVSAAIDLLKNVQVQAILGPQKSTQLGFVLDIGKKTQVPIISQATSPTLSPSDNPYFIRGGQNGSSQVESLSAIVKAFGWREVVLIYEDTEFGRGIGPYLADSFLGISTQVRYRIAMSVSATYDHILQELYKLKTLQTRVFVVHMLPSLASRFFLKVKEVGMMNKGYVWIITDVLTNLLDSLDANVIGSMQGVLGVKPYVRNSNELQNFTQRWRKRFRREHPDMDRFELSLCGLWAYDSATALAMAVERSGIAHSKFKKPVSTNNLIDLTAIGYSKMGPRLLQAIKKIKFQGLSGEFHLVDGQLQQSAFQIVNVIGKGEMEIGFWTREYGISKKLRSPINKNDTNDEKDLEAIIWPGRSSVVPKGWEIPTGEQKLRVGVPVKNGINEFIKVERHPQTNAVIATGFCIDVFKEIMNHALPYAVPYEFIPFETRDGEPAGDYNDLVYQIYLGNYDAVVGDVTILANRSNSVDFTLPFTESSVAMIVPIQDDGRKNAWIFMKPLQMDLWLTIGVFFIFTGFVVWVLEHRENKQFRGPPSKQVGMIFWFSFSTLVFAHREKLVSNLSRFVVIVWVFVVLVLTSSYTASLTSMLTVEKLQPSVTDIKDLRRNGEYVGYHNGTFFKALLRSKEFNLTKSRNYSTFEQYDDALSKGSRNGGVAAIIHEVPYIRLFLSNLKYCTKYTMVGPIYKTAGFGFAFPKGSPLVPDVSRQILYLTEEGKIAQIRRQWFGEEAECADQDGARITSDSLNLESFKGLFLVAATSLISTLVIFLSTFLYNNRVILASNESSIWQKLRAMSRAFDEEAEKSFDASKKTKPANEVMVVPSDCPQSPVTSNPHLVEWIFTDDDHVFTTTENNTPIHETLEIEVNEAKE
ncbi:hypothetical protein Vadar_031628 [Vaccinium darrowii]|uniref:Uncharacterized protein n=1 Tax=Vaccinium darrowii TaxID=229202 RepID=A0ACB7Z0J7_9ERIC|nr:hypothetical protein Vadar_031628 [Vaccinium darrowii]